VTRRRVLYVIDHQRPGKDRWLKPETMTTSVESTGDEAARELAERYELTTVFVVRHGSRIRVRVWPEPASLFSHDPDTEPAEGTWLYDPQAADSARQ
jgi:hypothetical protein